MARMDLITARSGTGTSPTTPSMQRSGLCSDQDPRQEKGILRLQAPTRSEEAAGGEEAKYLRARSAPPTTTRAEHSSSLASKGLKGLLRSWCCESARKYRQAYPVESGPVRPHLQMSDVNIDGSVIEVHWFMGDRGPTVFRTGSRGEIRDGHGCTLYVTHSTLRGKSC